MVQAGELPELPYNAEYVKHANECYDWGTFGWAIQGGVIDISVYKYYIFLNSSIRGPYLPPYLQVCCARFCCTCTCVFQAIISQPLVVQCVERRGVEMSQPTQLHTRSSMDLSVLLEYPHNSLGMDSKAIMYYCTLEHGPRM